MFIILLGIYLAVELLGHMVTCLTLCLSLSYSIYPSLHFFYIILHTICLFIVSNIYHLVYPQQNVSSLKAERSFVLSLSISRAWLHKYLLSEYLLNQDIHILKSLSSSKHQFLSGKKSMQLFILIKCLENLYR